MSAALLAVLAAASAFAAPRRPDVVLVTLEAVRADRLGGRRAGEPLTPGLDALGAEGEAFAAYSQAPWTVPSVASLMTSRYPDRHGVVLPAPKLPEDLATLAETLRVSGYRTGAFLSGAPADPAHGLARGFSHVGSYPTRTPDLARLTDDAERWLAEGGDGPSFVWIHGFNTHLPYRCPDAFRERWAPAGEGLLGGSALSPKDLPSEDLGAISRFIYHFNGYDEEGAGRLPHYPRDAAIAAQTAAIRASPAALEHLAARYDGCVRYSDDVLASLRREVERRRPGRTVWIVTADHGEYPGRAAWTDRPLVSHPFADMHEELLRVPLVLAGPGVPRRGRVEEPVELVDVAPTVLLLAGAAVPSGMEGRSLAAPDGLSSRGAYAADFDPDAGRWTRAARGGRFKLLRSTAAWALFDLREDPGERREASESRPDDLLAAQRLMLERSSVGASSSGPALAPLRLDLSVSLDPKGGRFTAQARHRLRLLSSASSVVLASRGLKILSVTDERGEPLPFSVSSAAVSVLLPREAPAGAELAFSVRYEGRSRHAGLHFVDGQVWSQGQPDQTSYWIPVVDSPAQRCPTSVTAEVPEGYAAVSNGVLVSSGPARERGRSVYKWDQRLPHPVHLIALYAAPYEPVELPGSRVRIWAPPGRAADAASTFAAVPRMMSFLEQTLGAPYPWERYEAAVVRGSRFGGLENTGALALRQDFVQDAAARSEGSVDGVLMHELAHQWAGDLISAPSWEDAWLNEALASYLQSLWTEREEGEGAFEADLDLKARRYFEEARSYRRPLAGVAAEDPQRLFDRHAYDKGAWVLHMIRRRAGDAAFFAALRAYFAGSAGGAAGPEELRAALSAAGASKAFDDVYAGFASRGGHPRVRLSCRWDAARREAVVTARQLQAEGGGPLFDFTLDVGLGAPLRVAAEEATARYKLPSAPKFLRVDPGQSVLAEYELDVPRERLAAALEDGGDPGVSGRLRAARALADAGGEPALAAFGACLRDESPAVAAACAEGLGRFFAGASDQRQAALSSLMESLDHAAPAARLAAIAAIGRFRGSAQALAALTRAARSAGPRTRAAALDAMGGLGLEEARPALVAALDAEEPVAAAALLGLGRLGGETSRKELARWTRAGRPAALRAAALGGLATAAGAEAEGVFLAALRDDDRRVRSAAVAALAAAKAARAADALRAVAREDPEPEMRRLAAEAARSVAGGAP